MSWEVRTMRSVTSCFNPALFKKNLSRFWPIWTLYGLIWIFALPINLMLSAGSRGRTGYSDAIAYFAHRTVLDIAGGFAVPMSAFFGILAAMAVCSYLYSPRSVGLFHSLPIRREGLFLTNYLSGLSFFLIPNAAVFFITLCAEAVAGAVNPANLCVWFLTQLLCVLFFYSFAVFCAMFTGHILALPAFYIILNFLASILSFIIQGLLSAFLYGFVYSSPLDRLALWLTPFRKLIDVLDVRADAALADTAGPITAGTYTLCGLGYAIIYAVAGLVLACLALLVYRRRHLETAGDIVAVKWVRPIFKYGFASCAAVTFGSFLYSIFSYSLPEGAWTLLIFMAICGSIGYFAAEMLLQKSFRVFRKWKGCVVLLICLTAVTAALELDITGFESRVPDPASVASATVMQIESAPYDSANYPSFEVSDSESLELLRQIHQRFIALGEEGAEDYDAFYSSGTARSYASLRVDYTLKSGALLSRYYSSALLSEADLEDPDSLASLLTQFINLPSNIRAAYRLDEVNPDRLVDISVDIYQSAFGLTDRRSAPTEVDRLRLWNAVLADFEEGTLGQRYLFDASAERQENTCINDLTVEFLLPPDKDGIATTESIGITLTPHAVHTIAVLEDLGLLDGTEGLISHADWEAMYLYDEGVADAEWAG